MIKNAFILNFFRLYNMLWRLALPFLKKNRRLHEGFKKRTSTDHLTPADIWIQAASAGEAYLAVEIIKKLKHSTPLRILVTSMTLQGKQILENHFQAYTAHHLAIEWFPFDMPELIEKAVKKISPGVMVLLETEIWPGLLYHLKTRNIPVAIVNGRLSKNSYKWYRLIKWLLKPLCPSAILAISPGNARRFKKIFDKSRVATMPNIKFESLASEVKNGQPLKPERTVLKTGRPVTILASVRKGEEAPALEMINTLKKKYPGQVIAVFPRHMHRISAWQKKLSKNGFQYTLRSRLTGGNPAKDIVLWDTFGEMKTVFKQARVVFMGGSLLPLGGQNFLEPVMYGIPTVIGPHYDDFEWVGDDIFSLELVYLEKTPGSVAERIVSLLKTPENLPERMRNAQAYFNSNSGGTGKACELILNLLSHARNCVPKNRY